MTKRKVSNKGTPIKGSPWILGFVIIYTSLQILIPLRHLLYKRNLQWTHEGSNFSWRMMADRHETNGSITIEDPRTKDVYTYFPERLNDNQYIQHLKQHLKQQTDIKNPIIRADIQVSLNGRPFQYMFEPTCNLSEVNYSPFKDLKWILPLKKN